MNMRFWRDWLLLWALVPVWGSFLLMAILKEIRADDPYAALHALGSVAVVLAALFSVFLVPVALLRKHLPRYGAAENLVVLGAIFYAWIALILMAFNQWPVPLDALAFEWHREFFLAVRRVTFNTSSAPPGILSLPWWKLIVPEFLTAAAIYAAPVFFLCKLVERPAEFFRAAFFMAIACCATVVSDALFEISRIREPEFDALNGRRWIERLGAIGTWSLSSAIGASISAIGFSGILPEGADRTGDLDRRAQSIRIPGYLLVFLVTAVLWSAAYLVDESFRR